jgi:hypothetical protein
VPASVWSAPQPQQQLRQPRWPLQHLLLLLILRVSLDAVAVGLRQW